MLAEHPDLNALWRLLYEVIPALYEAGDRLATGMPANDLLPLLAGARAALDAIPEAIHDELALSRKLRKYWVGAKSYFSTVDAVRKMLAKILDVFGKDCQIGWQGPIAQLLGYWHDRNPEAARTGLSEDCRRDLLRVVRKRMKAHAIQHPQNRKWTATTAPRRQRPGAAPNHVLDRQEIRWDLTDLAGRVLTGQERLRVLNELRPRSWPAAAADEPRSRYRIQLLPPTDRGCWPVRIFARGQWWTKHVGPAVHRMLEKIAAAPERGATNTELIEHLGVDSTKELRGLLADQDWREALRYAPVIGHPRRAKVWLANPLDGPPS